MGEIIPISERLKIRHVGIIDLSEFYRWIHAWFEFQGYNAHENWYEERIFPNGAKYIEIRWNAEKKKTNYIKYKIGVHFLLIGISDIEVGERKIKYQKGDFEIGMFSEIEKGYVGGVVKTPKSEFTKIFLKIYDRFIIRKRIEEYKVDLYDKFYSLHDEIVAFFDQYVK